MASAQIIIARAWRIRKGSLDILRATGWRRSKISKTYTEAVSFESSHLRRISEFKFPPEMRSRRRRDTGAEFQPNPIPAKIFHAPRGSKSTVRGKKKSPRLRWRLGTTIRRHLVLQGSPNDDLRRRTPRPCDSKRLLRPSDRPTPSLLEVVEHPGQTSRRR